MKKYLPILIALSFVLGSSAIAATTTTLHGAIAKYKTKNYVGCIQDAEEITKKDPSNVVAYYYMAIAYASIGLSDKAVEAYTKVTNLDTNQMLTEYSEKGIKCIQDPQSCEVNDDSVLPKEVETELDKFIKSGSTYSYQIEKQLNEIRLRQIKNSINKEVDSLNKSELPTNDQIAEAVKTLAKAGINPFQANQNPYAQAQQAMLQNPEYWQMQMMLGNNANYANNDFMSGMLPFMLSQNQNTNSSSNKMTADMYKNMMMSSMLGSINTTFDTNYNRL